MTSKTEMLNLYGCIKNINVDGAEVKFKYALARNIKKLEPEFEAVQEALKPNKEYIDYEEEQKQLNQKYILKDKDGKPVPGDRPNSFKIDDNNPDYLKEKLDFESKNETIIKAQQEKIETIDKEFLKSEIDCDIYQISFKDVPVDKLQPQELYALFPMIKESEEEIEGLL